MQTYDIDIEKTEITVVIVSWYSAKFIARLIKNLRQKAAYPNHIHFLIVDNTNGEDLEISSLYNLIEGVDLHPLDSRNYTGSRGHAIGLDYAFERITTYYTLVIDPDVYVFKHKWDIFFTSELQKEGAVAIGAPYPWWKLGKYHDFPSPPFIFFETNSLHMLGESWIPFSTNLVIQCYNFLARLFVRMYRLGTRKRLVKLALLKKILQTFESIAGVCSPDTGWRIATAARKARLKSILFKEAVINDDFLSNFEGVKAAKELACEYEFFHYKGSPMIVHMYSSYSYFWSTMRGNDEDFWLSCIERFETALKDR